MRHSTFFYVLLLCVASLAEGRAQQIRFMTNPQTGAMHKLTIERDDRSMDWLVATDGTQYPSVTQKYGWGLGYFTEVKNGVRTLRSWERPTHMEDAGHSLSYRSGDIQIDVQRTSVGSDVIEEYTFTNKGNQQVTLADIGIYTPFNDNYPDAETCVEARAHAHIWPGGNAAYVNATHMGGKAPHLGLVLLNGAVSSYAIWGRGMKGIMSNTRGIIALNIPDAVLKAGQKTSVKWTIFSHTGWDDFFKTIQKKGNIVAQSNQYMFQKGETARIEIRGDENVLAKSVVTKMESR